MVRPVVTKADNVVLAVVPILNEKFVLLLASPCDDVLYVMAVIGPAVKPAADNSAAV